MVQVAGCGRGGRVAELLADNPDVHPFLPEFACVRVPEPVGVDPLLDAGLAGQSFERVADVGGQQG